MSCRLWSDYKRTYETCPVAAGGDASFYSFEYVYTSETFFPTMHNITDGADDLIDNPVTAEEAVYVDVAAQGTWFTGSTETMQIVVRNPGLQAIDNVRQVRASDGSQAGELTVTVDVAVESTILIEATLSGGPSAPWQLGGYNELIILYDVGCKTYSVEHALCVNCE